jgi:hypothetical protein
MDQVLSQNLKIILGDQQQKLNALSKVDPTKIGVDPKATSGYLTDIISNLGWKYSNYCVIVVCDESGHYCGHCHYLCD